MAQFALAIRITLFLLIANAGRVCAAGGDAPGDVLFESPRLSRFSIEIADTNLARLKFGGLEYVPATVRVGALVLREVGVRLKGRGSFRPVNDRPSLALKFDAFHPHQNLFRLTKIMLNNASQDTTLLSEYLASVLFREAGVPSARVTHARVDLNGRDLGFYVVVEAMNKTFLRRHFENPDGNLYEGYARDVDEVLDQDNGVQADQADRRALVSAAGAPLNVRRDQINRQLDVDRFISFLAVTMLSAHHDSYPLNRNNFRIYHDPTSERFVMIPHGIDGSFSRSSMPVEPPQKYLLVRALMELPEVRDAYRRRLQDIFAQTFDLESFTNRVRFAVDRLKSISTNAAEQTARESAGNAMLKRIVRRHQNVENQLAGRVPVFLDLGSENRATVSGWEPEVAEARIQALRSRHDNVEALGLRFQPGPGVAAASWRATVSLVAGRYVFTARVSALGISAPGLTASDSIGATIRVSGSTAAKRIASNVAWERLEHRFVVREPGDVQLVCELRAAQGEAWFDVASLQLSKE